MRLHPEELELAKAYHRSRRFEDLNASQMHAIRERGRELFRWFKGHQRLHNLINPAVILLILVADAFSMLGLPRLILSGDRSHDPEWILFASVVAGCLHGWVIYSLTVLSLHEGAAHNLVFSGTGVVADPAAAPLQAPKYPATSRATPGRSRSLPAQDLLQDGNRFALTSAPPGT